jgi:hypothetical protein
VDIKAKIGLGVGGAVVAIGAAVGVGALAANLAGGDTATARTGYGQDAPDGTGSGPRGGGAMDTAALAKTMATKLGVDETTMASALKEVMAASRPAGAPSGQPSGQPSGAPSGQPSGAPSADANGRGVSGMTETMAKALATRLNLDEAKVLAALQEAMAAQRSGK